MCYFMKLVVLYTVDVGYVIYMYIYYIILIQNLGLNFGYNYISFDLYLQTLVGEDYIRILIFQNLWDQLK